MITRRSFGRMFTVAAAGAALTPFRVLGGESAESLKSMFVSPDGMAFPIILRGQAVVYADRIKRVDTFQPFYGQERSVVNPTRPAVRGSSIEFSEVGEYYLILNGTTRVRTLVLSEDESILQSILRLFDFCVANLVWADIDDGSWYKVDRITTIKRWFASDRPLAVSCGPTHQFFRAVVEERFGLPGRVFTLPGVFRGTDGIIARETHNIPEIYLPDIGKWMMFDLNNGYVPLWLDAIELAEIVQGAWGSQFRVGQDWRDLPVDFHSNVTTFPYDWARRVQIPRTPGAFDRRLLLPEPLEHSRNTALHVVSSGPAYWGLQSMFGPSGGTWFLPYDYAWVSLQRDPELIATTLEWVTSFGMKVTMVSPSAMRMHLEKGHARQIGNADWECRFPQVRQISDVPSKTAQGTA